MWRVLLVGAYRYQNNILLTPRCTVGGKFDELGLICYSERGMGEITLRKALDDYKTVYMPYRNFAERTRVEYQNDLTAFLEFLEKLGIKDVKKLSLSIIERYVAHLEQKGYASITRKRKVVTIRSFLSFLYQEGYIGTNLAQTVVLPFTETTIPHILTQTECDLLRKACAENPRDVAIVELVLQTGIKLSEIVHLTLNDMEFEPIQESENKRNGFIRVLGRRKKERMIPLNEKACLALQNYLDRRGVGGNNILFLNRFDEPVSERGVQKMLRKYLKRAGIERASIHTLRHTFGAYQLAKGVSLETLQEVMGHRDSRDTAVYRSVSKEHL